MKRATLFALILLSSTTVSALTGYVVGAAGSSKGARFGITGAVQTIGQGHAQGTQYSVNPLAPGFDAIFNNGFE